MRLSERRSSRSHQRLGTVHVTVTAGTAPVLAKSLASATLLAAVLLEPASPAFAQGGWSLTPSIGLTEEFDDNIFGTSAREESDFITRVTPGLGLGFKSAALTFDASYSFDAEAFADHTDLSDPANRQRGALELKFLPTPLLTLGATASYDETQTPSQLLLATGIELGRHEVTQLIITPSAEYKFTERISGTGDYSYTRQTIVGGTDTTIHFVHLALGDRLTPRDAGTLRYRAGVFESAGSDTTSSHTFTLGWSRKLTERTDLTLEGGPRFSEGRVDPEVSARLEQRFLQGSASLTYARSESTVIGRAGSVNVESVLASLTVEPLRSLRVNLAPGVWKTTGEPGTGLREITVIQVNAEIVYQITRWMSARLAYRYSHEDSGRVQILHNVVSIGLQTSFPTPLQ